LPTGVFIFEGMRARSAERCGWVSRAL
jgi:hypothetical protein